MAEVGEGWRQRHQTEGPGGATSQYDPLGGLSSVAFWSHQENVWALVAA